MGTRTNQRRRRAQRRGLASFVAFVLLFAFALGQGSSLIAFANDGFDVSDLLTSDATSTDATGEEAPATDEGNADEGAADEGATDGGAADEGAADQGASTSTGGNGAKSRRIDRAAADSGGSAGANAIAAKPSPGGLEGGDISLDYVAAGPFTYDHATGLGDRPEFGYDNRSISKSAGVVESLEAGDFECGDYVTFFTEITVDDGAGGSGTIELDYSFGAETTGQPGLGFSDIIAVAVNEPDDGNQKSGDEVATLISETPDPAGNQAGYDQVLGTVEITGLDPGEVVIIRLIAELTCEPGEEPTGNILNAIESGRVSSNDDDTISVGQQTVPMKTSGFVAEPAIDIEKTCPAASPFGDDITYSITITNNGNDDLDNIVVTDTVDGNDPVDISDLFADTLAPTASDTAEFVYSPDGSEPDPLPNTVEVTADSVHSTATVTDTDTCDTDITHEPGIDVTKSCPDTVPAGEAISYTITVENTGNEPLVDVTVDDTLLGDITAEFDVDLSNPFPVGGFATAVVEYTPQAGDPDPLTNTVTATGTGEDSEAEASDEASCETDILNPAISITKSCPEAAAVGDDVTYEITIENTGDEDLESVEVWDTVNGNDPVDLSDLFPDTLDAGSDPVTVEWTYEADGTEPDPLPNDATVTATGVLSSVEVSDTDGCETDITHEPGIDVTKSCPESVPFGEDITYTITVENTGNEPLEGVTVIDTLLGDITEDFDVDFSSPFPVGGFATAEVTYSPGEEEDPVLNTVTATGTGADSGVEDSDEASCETDITHEPDIAVTKACVPVAHEGDVVTYTITVENTGTDVLENVTVLDTVLGDLSESFGDTLAVGASETQQFEHTIPVGGDDPLVNIVTASAIGADSETEVSSTATCTTDILHPAITIVKTVNDDLVPVGTTVTYTYLVTNTGDTTLYDISVDDDIMGHIGDIAVLEPGQSAELMKDFVVGEDVVINVGTATGTDILGRSVSASDDAIVTPIAGNPPEPPTPFTGSDAGRLGLLSMVLLGLGLTVVAATRRRRRPEAEAA